MNKDVYRPFGDSYSATASDFKLSDSYRWVRRGAASLFIGYLAVVPLTALLVYEATNNLQGNRTLKSIMLLGLAVGVVLIAIGCCLLALSPRENEKRAARAFLIAYGIAIVFSIAGKSLDIVWLKIPEGLAQCFGLQFLITYFQVLALNRENPRLHNSVTLANKLFLVLMLSALTVFLVGIGLGAPMTLPLIGIGVGFVCFFVIWLRTLWYAYMATRPITSDFSIPNG